MIALIQRVLEARVDVAGSNGMQTLGRIDHGLLALIGVTREDTEKNVARMAERLLSYRVFEDDAGRMNRSIRETEGSLLLVPQFTLAADTKKGTRPGFSTAAPPETAEKLFTALAQTLAALHPAVQTGRFGAEMFVSLINHGPVTFWLDA